MQWVVKRVAEYHSDSHLPERFQKWVCCSPTDCWHLAIENCQSNSIRAFIFKCRSFAWQNLFQRPSYKFIFPPHAFLYMSSLKKKKKRETTTTTTTHNSGNGCRLTLEGRWEALSTHKSTQTVMTSGEGFGIWSNNIPRCSNLPFELDHFSSWDTATRFTALLREA